MFINDCRFFFFFFKLINANSNLLSTILSNLIGIRSKGYTVEVEKYLRSLGADFHKISRGGLITFHGFGQLTVYPILYLGSFKTQKSVKKYVCMLEDVIVNAGRTILKDVDNVFVSTLPEYQGVWINEERKLAAIGIGCKRYVTMHGVSLNCNTNLDWFEHIVPCGIEDKEVTSLSRELGRNFTVNDAIPYFLNSFKNVFKCELIEVLG